eukprot:3251839-Rhodomonas_salina.2
MSGTEQGYAASRSLTLQSYGSSYPTVSASSLRLRASGRVKEKASTRSVSQLFADAYLLSISTRICLLIPMLICLLISTRVCIPIPRATLYLSPPACSRTLSGLSVLAYALRHLGTDIAGGGMSGAKTVHGSVGPRARYAMSAYGGISQRARYAMPGTDVAYGASRPYELEHLSYPQELYPRGRQADCPCGTTTPLRSYAFGHAMSSSMIPIDAFSVLSSTDLVVKSSLSSYVYAVLSPVLNWFTLVPDRQVVPRGAAFRSNSPRMPGPYRSLCDARTEIGFHTVPYTMSATEIGMCLAPYAMSGTEIGFSHGSLCDVSDWDRVPKQCLPTAEPASYVKIMVGYVPTRVLRDVRY